MKPDILIEAIAFYGLLIVLGSLTVIIYHVVN